MDLWNKPLMRVLCAEPLEGRWLLSAAAPGATTEAAAGQTATVTLGEFEKIGEEEEDDDVVISPAALPANVLAAFNAKYAGADITEAELEYDDERGTEYGVSAEYGGRQVDLTISPSGEIVETETFIDLAEVPPDVIEKIREEFQGAEISEAADLGDGRAYEVLFTDASGEEWEVEALRSVTTSPPPTPVGEAPPEQQTAVAAAPDAPPDVTLLAARTDVEPPEVIAAAAGALRETESVAQPAATADAERQQREDAIEQAAAAAKAARATETNTLSPDRIAEALDALAAGAGASAWLPEVAGAVIEALPVDLAAIERGMQGVLRQFAAVGGAVKVNSGATPLATGASRLAVGITLVAAIKMLLNQSKKPANASGALVFGPAHSSWGWVLGTGSANRRRVASRQRES